MKNDSLAAVLVFSAFLAACSGGQGPSRQPVRVQVDTVSSRSTETAYNYTGTLEESYSSQLSFLVGGTLRQVNADAGQRVSKGQRLASLDDASLSDAYAAAKSNFDKAEDAYRRMKMLHDAGSLPEIKWVDVQTSLAQARSIERIAAKELRDAVLYAPFDGIIAQRYADPGVNVGPTVPVLRLVKIDKVYARVAVPEGDLAALSQGMDATVAVGALAVEGLPGKITEKGVTADPLSHTYPVKIEVDNSEHRLMPGMVCSVAILSPVPFSRIVLPPSAVQTDDKGREFVWLVREGKADKRLISVGELVGNGVEVASGLSDGDAVIVDGNQKVNQGMEVTVL